MVDEELKISGEIPSDSAISELTEPQDPVSNFLSDTTGLVQAIFSEGTEDERRRARVKEIEARFADLALYDKLKNFLKAVKMKLRVEDTQKVTLVKDNLGQNFFELDENGFIIERVSKGTSTAYKPYKKVETKEDGSMVYKEVDGDGEEVISKGDVDIFGDVSFFTDPRSNPNRPASFRRRDSLARNLLSNFSIANPKVVDEINANVMRDLSRMKQQIAPPASNPTPSV